MTNFAKDNGFNNVALIIGINDYSNSKEKFKRLNNAAKDARDLAIVLDQSYGYNVHLFADERKQDEVLSGNLVKEPTLDAIDTFLKQEIPKIVEANKPLKTCLLFYFAGHGVAEKSDTDPKGFLIPQDAEDNGKNWLEMKTVYEALAESKCHHVLAVLDSCYSGAFLWAIGSRKATLERSKFYKEHLTRYQNQATQLLMYSAAYNQEASDGNRGESNESGNSPFAAALIDVLKHNVDTSSKTGFAHLGIITTTQLFSEIQDGLSKAIQQPGVYPLKREFVGREYIFYNPQFDASNLEPAPAINEQNNPYRGLQAFEERHAAVFRGRTALTEKLFEQLHLPITTNLDDLKTTASEAEESIKSVLPLTIVLGNSGSGKSSLVQAGLLPFLRKLSEPGSESDKAVWRILDPIRPGAEPLMSLARAFLPIAQPELLNHEGLRYLNRYFGQLIEQQPARETQENKVHAIQETQPTPEQSATIQFAQSWKKTYPEARLLIVRDYYDDEKNCFNVQGLEQLRLPSSVKDFYSQIKGALDQLFQQLDDDAKNDEPTALVTIVQTWHQKQKPNSRLLLVADQLEELITLDRPDKAKAKAAAKQAAKSASDRFLNTLLAVLKAQSGHFQVVMTLRSDFEPRFLTTPLKDWLPYSRFPVRPMSSNELRQAIEEPAQAHALEFEPPELVGQLIDELGQPGALPLLSFVLSELYLDLAKVRQADDENRTLALDEHNQPGGIVGFLSRRADTEYETLKRDFGEEEGKYYQAMMQKVMLRMVTIEGGSSAKRRVPKAELDYPRQENVYCKAVIDRLVNARLLVEGRDEGEPYYEPAHDYLINGWALLQTWIEEEKEDLALQQRLIPAAKDWQRKAQPLGEQNNRSSGKITRWTGVKRESTQLVRQVAYLVGRLLFLSFDGVEFGKRQLSKFILRLQKPKDSDRRHEKPAAYLWDNDPRINQLSFLLDKQSWLNKLEAEFVRHSVVQKQQWRTVWVVVGTVIAGIVMWAGGTAMIGQRKAQIEQAKTAVESANARLQTGQDLNAIGNAISGSAALNQGVRFLGISMPFPQPTTEQNHLQEALFKSVYLTKERNRLSSNRGSIYQVATTPANAKEIQTQVAIATVEERDSVRLLNAKGEQLFQLSACSSAMPQTKDSKAAKACKSVSSVALGVISKPKDDKHKQDKQLQLATGGNNGVVYLWDVKPDGTINETNPPQLESTQQGKIDQLAYNAEGTQLASIQKGKVWLWSLTSSRKNGKPKRLPIISTEPSSIAFNPNPKNGQLAVGFNDGHIEIWDLSKSSSQKPELTIETGMEGASLAFSQDGRTLAVGGSSEAVKLFAVGSNGTIDPASSTKVIDTKQPRTYNLAFLDNNKLFLDNNQLLAVGVSDTVGRYAVSTREPIGEYPIAAQQTEERQIKSVVYSPDGELIATVADDDSIRLWNRQGQQLARSDERDYYVQSLAFSPDGRMLVSSGGSTELDEHGKPGSGFIEAWKIDSQKPDLNEPIATYGEKSLSASKNVEFVQLNPARKAYEIVSLGVDGKVTWLDIDKAHKFTVGAEDPRYGNLAASQNFAFSPTGEQGAIIKKDGVLELWEGKKQVSIKKAHYYTSVAFSADGAKLAAGSADGQVQFWEVSLSVSRKLLPGKPPLSRLGAPLQAHQKAVNTLAFRPGDSNTLSTGGADGEVKFWDLSQARPDSSRLTLRDVQTVAFSSSAPISAPQSVVSSLQPGVFSQLPGGELLQSMWEQTSRFLSSLNPSATHAPVQRLAVTDHDEQLKLWAIQPDGSATLSATRLDPSVKAELAAAQQLVLSPDGNLLVAITTDSADSRAKVWNLESGKAINWQTQNQAKTTATPSPSPVSLAAGKAIQVTDAKFSQDGKVLMTLDKDKKLKLWDVTDDLMQTHKIQPPTSQSPESPNPQATETQPNNPIADKTIETLQQVAISPDHTLAILSKDLIEFWKLETLEKSGEFRLPQPARQILFSPDGKLIVSVGEDKKIEVAKLWDYKKRSLIKTLELPSTESTPNSEVPNSEVAVAFSPDSHLILTTNRGGILSLWSNEENTNGNTEGQRVFQFPDPVKSASFTADGKHLAIVLPNGELSLWSIDQADLLAKACAVMRDFKPNNPDQSDTQTCPKDRFEIGAAFSSGERLLIPSVTNLYKLAGINRFRQNKFKDAVTFKGAVTFLDQALKQHPNDPEALIYDNNAKILEDPANTEANIHTIAVPVPIHTNLNAAQEILRGVAQAQKEINDKGGIKGKLLRVIIANDNDDPAIAKQVAQRLVDDPDVKGVVGHYASGTTMAANEIYAKGKLVSISPVSTAVDLFKADLFSTPSPYAFRTVPDDRMAAQKLADYMVSQGKTKAVVFYNSKSLYSKSLAEEFSHSLKQKGANFVDEQIDISTPDFNAAKQMQTIADNNKKENTAIALFPNSGTVPKAIEVMQQNALVHQPFLMLGGDDIYALKFLEDAGKAAKGLVVAVPWNIDIPWNIDRAPHVSFATSSRARWQADVNWRSVAAYDAVMALAEGLRRSPTREGLAKALRAADFKAAGATAPIKFQQDSGDREQESGLVQVIETCNHTPPEECKPPSRSKTGYDFHWLDTNHPTK